MTEEIPQTGYRQRCPQCDREISAAARYCQWCGEQLGGSE